MELRHLRYFIAVAEEGSLTVAAEKRLHTAQPSLSRQMRDLELELGVTLLERRARGVELTAAGRVFLDHAKITLLQVQSAVEATRAAGRPPKATFAVGFLTGYELEWLPPLMEMLREVFPTTQITIQSEASPVLADGLVRGDLDMAFMRKEDQSAGLVYKLLREEPLIAVMAASHLLAKQAQVRAADLKDVTRIGVPYSNARALRIVTDRYAKEIGIDLTPDHEALNLAMAISLVISTGGIALLPFYARNFMPQTVVSRPLEGKPPRIDLSLGYSSANSSPLLKKLLSKIEELKFRIPG